MELSGEIKKINKTQTIGSNGFQKRELVVNTAEQYPQIILIEFVQDKCELLNNFNIGDMVVISINIRGREWINPEGQVKYFNTIQGWKITSKENPDILPPPPTFIPDEEDLPF